jgi:hypothetical protein
MPCRDYQSDSQDYYDSYQKMKKQCDKLARIACKSLQELEDNSVIDVLLLKDDEVREWWIAHQEADRKEKARVAEIERREQLKADALSRLTDEEKEVLGLAKAKKSKSGNKSLSQIARRINVPNVVDLQQMSQELQDIYDWIHKDEDECE